MPAAVSGRSAWWTVAGLAPATGVGFRSEPIDFLVVSQRLSAKRRRRRIQRAVTVRASPKTMSKRRSKWVQRGEARTETWLNRSGGSLGPLIPHIAATAVLTGLEDRGWVPQGLAYSPEAKLLHAAKGEPLLTMERTTYNENGQPVELADHLYRASLYSFEIVLVTR